MSEISYSPPAIRIGDDVSLEIRKTRNQEIGPWEDFGWRKIEVRDGAYVAKIGKKAGWFLWRGPTDRSFAVMVKIGDRCGVTGEKWTGEFGYRQNYYLVGGPGKLQYTQVSGYRTGEEASLFTAPLEVVFKVAASQPHYFHAAVEGAPEPGEPQPAPDRGPLVDKYLSGKAFHKQPFVELRVILESA